MNEKNLQKVDYLLALIPILIFFYPILVFGGTFFKWFDVEILIILLINVYLIIIILLSSIGWGFKFMLKKKSTEEEKIHLIIESSLLGLIFGFVEGLIVILIIMQLLSLAKVEGTVLVIWEVLLGFILIVIVKVLGDLHHLPEVYNNLIDRFHTKLD